MNPLDILASLLPSKGDRARELIDSKIGFLSYLYYEYIRELHVRPLNWEEFIDGILYIGVFAEVKELYRSKK